MLLTGWFTRLCEGRAHRKIRRSFSIANHASLAAECLETRALLSNIAVTAKAGVITLTGDTGDHTLDASVVNGQLQLAGSNGTTLSFNGTTAATVDVPLGGTIKGLNIVMQGGNDTIAFEGAGLPIISGNVSVNLGDGADSFTFANATVAGNMKIQGGAGDDSIHLSHDAARAILIATGNGNDALCVAQTTVHGKFVVNTGNGTDAVDLSRDIAASIAIQLGDGNDCVSVRETIVNGNLGVAVGNGTDHVRLEDDTVGAVAIQAGSGNDCISVEDTLVIGRLGVMVGNGDDDVRLDDNTTGAVGIQAGDGNDTICVEDTLVNGKLGVVVGNGTDGVGLDGDIAGGVVVHIGNGNSCLHVSGMTLTGQMDPATAAQSSNEGKPANPLAIIVGNGDDHVGLEGIVAMGNAQGGKWTVALGTGNDTVHIESVVDQGFLIVSAKAAGTGNDVVSICDSKFDNDVAVTLPGGQEQIFINHDTFADTVALSTGTGSGSSISVHNSEFDALVKFMMAGPSALLNLQTENDAGDDSDDDDDPPGLTAFHGQVQVTLGASGVVNMATDADGDDDATGTLTFDTLVTITGNATNPATVNVKDANVTLSGNLTLHSATRVDS
jgi:hypothetical protein